MNTPPAGTPSSVLGRLRPLALAIGLGIGLCSGAASAATLYFGEDLGAGAAAGLLNSGAAEAAFLAALATHGTETLELLPAGSTTSLVFGVTGLGGTLSAATTVRNVPFNARFAADGTNYLDSSFNRRITFGTAVQAFGLYVIDANESNNNPATVTIGGATLTAAQIDDRPFNSVDGIFRMLTQRADGSFEVLFDGGTFPSPDSSGMFVGVVDAANPFDNIVLINGTSGLDTAFQDGFGYDRLTVGSAASAVPEPGVAALLALAGAALALQRRRRA